MEAILGTSWIFCGRKYHHYYFVPLRSNILPFHTQNDLKTWVNDYVARYLALLESLCTRCLHRLCQKSRYEKPCTITLRFESQRRKCRNGLRKMAPNGVLLMDFFFCCHYWRICSSVSSLVATSGPKSIRLYDSFQRIDIQSICQECRRNGADDQRSWVASLILGSKNDESQIAVKFHFLSLSVWRQKCNVSIYVFWEYSCSQLSIPEQKIQDESWFHQTIPARYEHESHQSSDLLFRQSGISWPYSVLPMHQKGGSLCWWFLGAWRQVIANGLRIRHH